MRVRSHGLRVAPHMRDSDEGLSPNSGECVLPNVTRPAFKQRST